MTLDHYYTPAQFMKLTHVTKKTLRYYHEHDILVPSLVDENGNRFYNNEDLYKMQQILLLKHLGFSLNEIREMTIQGNDSSFMTDSLKLQLRLVEERIEQLQIIAQTIRETESALSNHHSVDYQHMLSLLDQTGMEMSLKKQYQNTSNIEARIHLHSLYSTNQTGWFPWIYEKMSPYLLKSTTEKSPFHILEIGCGDGSLWTRNYKKLPENIHITLSDISKGMIRDIKRSLPPKDKRFSFAAFDCMNIPFEDDSYDIVIANHVLFYCSDIPKALSEIRRVLKKGGILLCGTYGPNHMKEVSELVQSFDDRILLSGEKLYERFGRQNGLAILSPNFESVIWEPYEDSLHLTQAAPLISYILSCHGNQNQYILDRYKEFDEFVKNKVEQGMNITKDAGIFICQK